MSHSSEVILSIAYFPPVQYFSKLIRYDSIIIEQHENYTKQSYRNRCEIFSPSGIQTLSIPVEKQSGVKQLVKDIKIDYALDWQSNHFKSIQTAYFSSPFYEYYTDAFMSFFKTKTKYLFDLNIRIIETVLYEIQVEKKLKLSETFKKEYPYKDLRNSIHPKIGYLEDKQFKPITYTQVFFDKYTFMPNLSVLDLLFNEGPNTAEHLESTFREAE